MYWNRSAGDVATAWQAEIENKLETGTPALLQGGAPDSLLASVTTLLGLQRSTLQRTDIATPWLVTGGNSALWLGLLLPCQPQASNADSNPNTPTPTVIYGGADAATYLAMIELTTARGAQPLGMGAQFAPRLQAGVATPWEMLPLLEAGEQSAHGTDAAFPQSSPQSLVDTDNDPTGDWIVWGIMLLAFCLVLSALLI